MKYGSASEYDEARRRAEFARARDRARKVEEQPEIDEEAADRIAGKLLSLKEQMAKMSVAEQKRREEAEAKATAHTLRANKLCMLMEWRSAGILPPERWRDAEGYPTMSIAFLLNMGWRFGVDEQGDKVLYLPPPKPKRKTREEWAAEWEAEKEASLKATLGDDHATTNLRDEPQQAD